MGERRAMCGLTSNIGREFSSIHWVSVSIDDSISYWDGSSIDG